MKPKGLWAVAAVCATLSGCATESSRPIAATEVAAQQKPASAPRVWVSIGKFENRSSHLRGVFSDGIDRLGNQAKTVLISHLQQSQRFNVLDRDNLSEARQEANLGQTTQAMASAEYLVTGDVTEFGRKEVGDQQFFGILGRGKSQVAYAKVTVNVVRVSSAEVVHSAQGAGEFSLSNREVIGFGGTASYDSTLNGKVLDLALREAVDKLALAVDSGALRSSR